MVTRDDWPEPRKKRRSRKNWDLWLAELRGTPLNQQRGQLFNPGFASGARKQPERACCLGIGLLCMGDFDNVVLPQRDSTMPSSEFTKWLGLGGIEDKHGSLLHEEDVEIDYPHEEFPVKDGTLRPMTGAELNDVRLTFAQIADCLDYFGPKGVTWV